MKKVKITKEHVFNIVDKIDRQGGLPRGLTDTVNGNTSLCVEAVINHVVHQEYGQDNPACVSPLIRSLSISLNDDYSWSSPYCRGEGLKRLAIAQLGSNSLDQEELERKLVEKLRHVFLNSTRIDQLVPRLYSHYLSSATTSEILFNAIRVNSYNNQNLTELAEVVVSVLKEMNCPGTKFLDLVRGG